MNDTFESTVIIPTYNRSDLIPETIESVIDQHCSFSEIIIVNDGSTDNTLDVLEKYHGRIRIINTSNLGVQNARNAGVKAAKTEWVTLCDSDDLLNPDYLGSVSQFLHGNPEFKLVYANLEKFSSKRVWKNLIELSPPGFFDGAIDSFNFYHSIPDLYCKVLNYALFWPTGMTINRQFYLDIGGYDMRMRGLVAEDSEFTMRAISQTNCALSFKPLVRIRRHQGNDSSDKFKRLSDEITILEFILDNHDGIDRYREEILKSIKNKNLLLFREAFERGLFSSCDEYISRLDKYDMDRKDIIKLKLANFSGIPARYIGWLVARIFI